MSAQDGIRNTLARYCQCLNTLDFEGYVALFTRDCKLYVGKTERLGHEGIRDHLKMVDEMWPDNFRTKHTLGSSIIEVDGDTATAVSDVVVFHSLDNKPWVVGQAGQYVDQLVVEDGEWRFQERRIRADTFVWPDGYLDALRGEKV